MYHFSDSFDTFLFSRCECIGIAGEGEFPAFENLQHQWQAFVEKEATALFTLERPPSRQKFPVLDIEFDVGEFRCVKPAPQWGKPSEFYSNGRPRNDSTGMTSCPPVGKVFPKLDRAQWSELRALLADPSFLRSTYEDWLEWKRETLQETPDPLLPVVEMPVGNSDFRNWLDSETLHPTSCNLLEFATVAFENRVRDLAKSAKCISDAVIVPAAFVLFRNELIGMDVANDLTTIVDVSTMPGLERETQLLENRRCSFHYGLAIASAYAVKLGRSCVLYEKDMSHAWH